MKVLTRGDVLADRYVLRDPVPSDLENLISWTAEDQILGRLVRVSLVSGPERAHALDEARRASLVADPRLTRVLDVGDIEDIGYVVTEPHVGQPLSAVLASGTLTTEQARSVVGELATALAVAERRGVHHGALRPDAVRIDDNRVHLTGLGLDGALVPRDGELTRSRADAVGLARLLAYLLTGTWTMSQPVPESELADLDMLDGADPHLITLVKDTLTTRTGGLRDGEQAVRDLAPWDAVDVPLPTPFAPTGLTATDDDPTDTKVSTDMTPGSSEAPKQPVRQSVRTVSGSAGGRPPGTPPPARPTPAPRAPVRRTSVKDAGAPAGTAAAAVAGAAGVGTAATGAAAAGRSAAGGRAAGAVPAAPASAPPSFSPVTPRAAETPAPQRISSRPPATATSQAPVPQSPHAPAASPGPRPGPRDGAPMSFEDVRKNPQEIKRFRFNPTILSLCIVFALIIVGISAAVSELRGGFPNPFGQSAGERPLPTTGETSGGESPGTTDTPQAVAPVILSARQLDPDGDDNEHPEAVDRAIDLDPTTFWFTRTYKSDVFAGMNRRGIGYAVKLEQTSLVSSVYLSTNNTGGKVEIRATDPATPDKGEPLFSGAFDEEMEISLPSPVETEWIVLWFPELPAAADGKFRVELREISLT